ncbi:palmitoyltransferase Pfa4p [Monosporozyma unispora]|nr:Palmitoyltransferase [Kazachstania unispora]
MAPQLKWPWLGVAIPTAIISFIAYNAHYFILKHFLSIIRQYIFEFSVTMIWISYLLAILTNPGKPPLNRRSKKDKFCQKCNNWKPERSHHCKTCNQCVLMMDHHCPWTLNCVGFNSFPHFIRFLLWIIISTSQLNWYFVKRILVIWKLRNEINISFTKTEFIFLTILTPFNFFIWCTISMLLIRCFNNQILHGRTQIESWELDRLESLYYHKKLVPILIDQIWKTYPKEATLQNKKEAELLLQKYETRRLGFDSIVNFPYDVDLVTNWNQVLGPILFTLLPWSKPTGDGTKFIKNDISQYEENSSIEDIILSLSWPPDGGRKQIDTQSGIEQSIEDGEFVIRKRSTSSESNEISPEETISRTQWENQWGEQLEDFGVDVNEE